LKILAKYNNRDRFLKKKASSSNPSIITCYENFDEKKEKRKRDLYNIPN